MALTLDSELLQGLKKRWEIVHKHEQAFVLAKALERHPLIGQLLVERGIEDIEVAEAYLNPKLSRLHDPLLLPNAQIAAKRIVEALQKKEQLVIYGDYDADGITATAILYHMCKTLAPEANIKRYIPHRIEEGYGLNKEALHKLVELGANLIVSVDCGITAVAEATSIQELPVDLIITDHHEIGEQLPPAFTWVHPRLPSETPYPFEDLCGAGVAYKLAWQVAREWEGTTHVSKPIQKLLLDLLGFVAIGTVADVVPLEDENRAMVTYGLKHLRQTPFEGLRRLLETAGITKDTVDSSQIGFKIGPRINACGRLGHAKNACELFTTATGERAVALSKLLDKINKDRQQIQNEIAEQALELVQSLGFDSPDYRMLVLSHPDWHAGVIGIVASKLVDIYHKPTVLLHERDGIAVGSARSIEGFNLHGALATCSELFHTFGGHEMAAGLSLPLEKVEELRETMLAYGRIHLDEEDLIPLIRLEAAVRLKTITTSLVEKIQDLGPFGRNNPEPMFYIPNVRVAEPPRVMGNGDAHLSLVVQDENVKTRCVGWGKSDYAQHLNVGDIIDLACTPSLNTFKGFTNVQLTLIDIRPHAITK